MSNLPSVEQLYEVNARTWPAASENRIGPWMIRDGHGGGQRVCAATLEAPLGDAGEIGAAEAAMQALDQPPLFLVRDGETALDSALEARGYVVKDPVNIYACDIDMLADIEMPKVMAFTIWEPLQIMLDIWASGGIGPARVEVMHRCQGPKTGLLARWNEQPAGTGFVAVHDQIAMVHALEILGHQRAQGVGKWLMRRAAIWARGQGATTMAVICTTENVAANALYASLSMPRVGGYHYRIKQT